MSDAMNAVRRLVTKSRKPVDTSTERFTFRERFGEFSIRDNGREMAVSNSRSDAETIIDALNDVADREQVKRGRTK